jgi:hypothetical protein
METAVGSVILIATLAAALFFGLRWFVRSFSRQVARVGLA